MIFLEDGATLLHIAAYQLDVDAMQWLLKNGADCTRETPLDERVKRLITNCADCNCQTSPEVTTNIRYCDAQRVLYERLTELDKADSCYQACYSVYKTWTDHLEMVDKRPSTTIAPGFFSWSKIAEGPSTTTALSS